MQPTGNFSAILSENPVLAYSHNVLDLPYGHVKFFRKRLKAYSVYEPPLQDFSIPFCVPACNPFVNSVRDL